MNARHRPLAACLPLLLVGCSVASVSSAASPTGTGTAAATATPAVIATAIATATATLTPTPATTSATAYPLHPCAVGAKEVTLTTADGVRVQAVQYGTGKRGIVLGHELDADLCGWVAFAQWLAPQGYTVLALDFRGYGQSAQDATDGSRLDRDLMAGVRHLVAGGVTQVVVAGASMGGTAALNAASRHPKNVVGVVSVSGPADFYGLAADVAQIRVPILLIAGADDITFADAADLMATQARKGLVTKKIYASGAHGTELVNGDPSVGPAIERFMRPLFSP